MATKQPQWLDNAIFYEIYPQSFNDTNADGIGDFQGIIEKLDYICNLGCNALWINPCFKSPFGDAGYDVADFYSVAPRSVPMRISAASSMKPPAGHARAAGSRSRSHLRGAPLVQGIHEGGAQ